MKLDKTAKEKVTKDFDKKFTTRIKKTDIIGYEIVDNSTMTGVKYMKEPREPQAPKWALELISKVDTLTDRVDTLTNRVDTLTNRVDTLTEKVDAIMECPTIKKELNKK